MTEKPVVGILEASAKIALQEGQKFGVVTTGAGWIKPLTKANQEILSEAERARFGGVVATGLGVLDFHAETDGASGVENSTAGIHPEDKVAITARAFVEEANVDVIVLGCAGMEGMDDAIFKGLQGMDKKVQVVDSVTAAVKYMASLLA